MENLESMASRFDVAWLILCAALVFVMQAGFLCLEAGFTRAKNNINVALKNLTDFGISVLLFWVVGASVMFGPSNGGFAGSISLAPDVGGGDPRQAAFLLFQAMFCGTAITIVSGAVAERMRFAGYLVVVLIQSGFVYTLFGHWAWAGVAAGSPSGALAARGFVDFAGSSVVHSVGGWVALAAVVVIGPRKGRFVEDGANRIGSSSLPFAMLGALLLWLGWFGFNGGSALGWSDAVPGIIANTVLAGAGGLLTGLFVGWGLRGHPHVGYVINGALAGLVAVTAGCHALSAGHAVIVGGVGSVVMIAMDRALERLRIDDVVGAVPVHAAAGAWGTLAVGLFGDLGRLGTGLDRAAQIQVQLLGIGVCFVWAFGVAYLLLAATNRLTPLRVTPDQEDIGLNVAEHDERTDLLELFRAMDRQAKSGDISQRVPVEPYTEVGQIASSYNRVLEALQRALARTQLIVENAFDGIVTFAKGDLLIERLNPSAQAMFGYAPAEVEGKSIGLLLETPAGPDIESALSKGAVEGREGQHHPREMLARRADGSVFPVEVVVTEIQEAGASFYTGTFRDITQRKRIEEALHEAKEAAESANRMKSQFLASMSHELRTPLNAIIGYSEMLQEDALEAGQEELHQDLQRIHAAGKHLLQLINDVLDLSKIEAGKLDLLLEAFDLSSMVSDVVDVLEPTFVKNRNRFETRIPKNIGTMHADQTRVRQCLFNLLSNASKFAYGERVTLELAAGSKGGEPVVVFRVRDEGIGISEAQLTALFQPFTQADASTSRKYGGSGLGLAISRRFCRMMGGEIYVESRLGEGATFTMELPRRVTPRALDLDQSQSTRRSVVPGPLSLARGRGTILAVDDDPGVLNLLERFLTRQGFRVVTASSGARALELASSVRPAAITLDVVMPDMDGWSVLRSLKADPELSNIPVIVVTMTDDMAQGFALGAADFLTKPIDRARLLSILAKLRPATGETNVLVVEDDPASREMLERLLVKDGCVVRVATNGVEALAAVAARLPDLILLDLMMPEMNGFEVVAELMQKPEWSRIPVVVVTAKELTAEDRERLNGQVTRVFRKGTFSREELLAELGRLLERSAPGPQNQDQPS